MKNYVIAGSIILAIVAIFYAGYVTGQKNSTVTMRLNPLVIANCPDIAPPTDRTFGKTTLGIINCAKNYTNCQTACLLQE